MTALVSEDWRPDRSAFKDTGGKFITQGLFLEFEYNPERAVYTFKDYDYEYQGKVFPSARRLYLETNDPTGYTFATEYLWGWDHWKQIKLNKRIGVEIAKWEEEMEIMLRSRAAKGMILSSLTNGAAAKWVSDGKWNEAKVGRPSKKRSQLERKIIDRAREEAAEDAKRLGLGGKSE